VLLHRVLEQLGHLLGRHGQLAAARPVEDERRPQVLDHHVDDVLLQRGRDDLAGADPVLHRDRQARPPDTLGVHLGQDLVLLEVVRGETDGLVAVPLRRGGGPAGGEDGENAQAGRPQPDTREDGTRGHDASSRLRRSSGGSGRRQP
jgi:hypothetical protein